MVESKDNELSVDQFKDLSSWFNADAQCDYKVRHVKMFGKVKNSPTWPKKPANWSGIVMHEIPISTSVKQ